MKCRPPVEPVVRVAWVGERIVAAEVPARTGVLGQTGDYWRINRGYVGHMQGITEGLARDIQGV